MNIKYKAKISQFLFASRKDLLLFNAIKIGTLYHHSVVDYRSHHSRAHVVHTLIHITLPLIDFINLIFF